MVYLLWLWISIGAFWEMCLRLRPDASGKRVTLRLGEVGPWDGTLSVFLGIMNGHPYGSGIVVGNLNARWDGGELIML